MEVTALHLHSYFRSSCTCRVRTAANLKGIHLTYTYHDLLKGGQTSEEYAKINPSLSVPTLIVTESNPPRDQERKSHVTQSVAILEFLEEMYPDKTPLLPPREDIFGRAHVRDLVNIITCDVQPPTNLRTLNRVKEFGGDSGAWAKQFTTAGLKAFDKLAAPSAGKHAYGDRLTLADVVLAPAVENAIRFGVDISQFETVNRAYLAVRDMKEFRDADYNHQADTPEDLRAKE